LLKITLNRLIYSTVVVLASNKCRKGCPRLNSLQTIQHQFQSNPLLSDSQPTSASWIHWIAYGWKNAHSSSSVRHSRSCFSDLWDSQSNADPLTVQCKVGNWNNEPTTTAFGCHPV